TVFRACRAARLSRARHSRPIVRPGNRGSLSQTAQTPFITQVLRSELAEAHERDKARSPESSRRPRDRMPPALLEERDSGTPLYEKCPVPLLREPECSPQGGAGQNVPGHAGRVSHSALALKRPSLGFRVRHGHERLVPPPAQGSPNAILGAAELFRQFVH